MLAASTLLVVSCVDETRLIVLVESDLAPAQIDRVEAGVRVGDAELERRRFTDPSGAPYRPPLSFVIRPVRGPDDPVDVEVLALGPEAVTSAVRAVTSSMGSPAAFSLVGSAHQT